MKIRLTDRMIRTLPPGSYYDSSSARGFGLRITPAGCKSYILRYRTRAGREHLLTIGSPPAWSLAAARAEAAELRREIDRGEDPMESRHSERNAPTVRDLADRFIAEHVARKRPSTANEYQGFIKNDVLPMLGSHKVSAITFSDISRLHRKITERAPIAANRCMAMCSAMFNLAIKWQLRADNPCRGVARNPEEKRSRYLSAAELSRLVAALASLEDRQAANIIKMPLLTGCRCGEALGATWSQFDLDADVWVKPSSHTKQKREHRVPLSDAAVELLNAIRAEAPIGSHVFPAARGSGHRIEIRRAWRQACVRAGIDGLRVHDLRHSYASMLVNSGLSLPVIGALLGHTQAATTHRYAHLADNPLREATERVGKMVTAARNGG